MGNYIFSTNLLLRELYADAQNRIQLPRFRPRYSACRWWAAPRCSPTIFRPTASPAIRPTQEPYWRDVGTIDAYYDANMDLRSVTPALNLYNRQWPLRTAGYSDAPAKFIFDQRGPPRAGDRFDCRGRHHSFRGHGAEFGARPRRARPFRGAGGGFDSVRQLRHRPPRQVRRAILDKNVRVPEDATIGYDLERDRELYHVTDSGIVVMEGHRSTVEIASMLV